MRASLELTTFEDTTIYDTTIAHRLLRAIATTISIIWNKDDTINVLEVKWISIDIIPNAKLDLSKVYFVRSQNRTLIDKKFDNLHEQEKMAWITKSILYDFLVFVVWRTIHIFDDLVRKRRVVIDIRNLNKIIVLDDYSMPLQSNITSLINDCFYINVINGASYFHQWRVKIVDRHKFIVISHRDSE